MRSSMILITVLAAAVSASRCSGGGGGSSQSLTTPGPSSNGVTVRIVGSAGNTAFNPNPVQAATGNVLVWKNETALIHHIVMDDGSADLGNIAAGASSTEMQLKSAGGNFHCVNHPSMVGSINGATAPTPPPGSGDGY